MSGLVKILEHMAQFSSWLGSCTDSELELVAILQGLVPTPSLGMGRKRLYGVRLQTIYNFYKCSNF